VKVLKKWLLFSLLTLLFVSGCEGTKDTNNTANYDLRKDRSAPEYMSYRSAGRDQPHLVEEDITNQNPNFLDLNRTGNGTEQGVSNTGIDIDKARQVVGRTKEFRPGSVWINGNRMSVTVYKKGPLTDKERVDAETRIRKKLVAALPRYSIKVKVREDRR
jgi:hypothetical protein